MTGISLEPSDKILAVALSELSETFGGLLTRSSNTNCILHL